MGARPAKAPGLGFLVVGRWRGTPIRLHWTLPLGALLFTGFQWSIAAWTGFILTILFHEFGHAYLCRRYGTRVIAIDLHGFGGLCAWQGEVTAMQRAKIAWGGVVAQKIVFAV